MLKQSGKYYNFGCVPNDEWRDVVTACRRQEKTQGKLLKIQKRAMLEGPIADTATQNFGTLPIPAEKFKPAMLNGMLYPKEPRLWQHGCVHEACEICSFVR
jgi:hypothetical protein